ncbi:hypothetical protein CRE_31198 [Caenorhabditis remanei]|uniref:Uncharacterized protein n=1 Tax=Caenorhabditis remanei TaxID=31234 RepID=E3MLJ3_CAERE|nr:hypothetical protein CRE_31198 [Caenorhabditis remanei]
MNHSLLLLTIIFLSCPTPGLTRKWVDRSKWISRALYKTTLNCPLDTVWCFTGYYREFDLFNANDDLAVIPFHCTRGNSVHSASLLLKGGDEDDSTKEYEPELELYHNCSKCSLTHRTIKDLYNIHTRTPFTNETYEYNLLNTGTSSKAGIHFGLFSFFFKDSGFMDQAMRGEKLLPPGIKTWFDSESFTLPSETGSWAVSNQIHFYDDEQKTSGVNETIKN